MHGGFPRQVVLDLYHVALKPTAVLAGLSQTAWCCFRSKRTTTLRYRKGADVPALPQAMSLLSGAFLTTPQGSSFKTDYPPSSSSPTIIPCVYICVYLQDTRANPAEQIFPEFLNHWRRLQKARVAADVLVLSLQKQREGDGGTHGRRERGGKRAEGEDGRG